MSDFMLRYQKMACTSGQVNTILGSEYTVSTVITSPEDFFLTIAELFPHLVQDNLSDVDSFIPTVYGIVVPSDTSISPKLLEYGTSYYFMTEGGKTYDHRASSIPCELEVNRWREYLRFYKSTFTE